MSRLNRRAGPHYVWFSYSMHPTLDDEVVFKDHDGYIWSQVLRRGAGEEVLALLGFVRGPEFWFRRVTERAG